MAFSKFDMGGRWPALLALAFPRGYDGQLGIMLAGWCASGAGAMTVRLRVRVSVGKVTLGREEYRACFGCLWAESRPARWMWPCFQEIQLVSLVTN